MSAVKPAGWFASMRIGTFVKFYRGNECRFMHEHADGYRACNWEGENIKCLRCSRRKIGMHLRNIGATSSSARNAKATTAANWSSRSSGNTGAHPTCARQCREELPVSNPTKDEVLNMTPRLFGGLPDADVDALMVGYSLMQAIKTHRPDYAWNNSPAEIVGDLCNELAECSRTTTAPTDGGSNNE